MLADITVSDANGWVLIIGAITTPILTLAGLVIAYLNNRSTSRQANRVEHEVKVVRANTNAALGESLRIAMIAAHMLASQKTPPNPEHAKLAEEAATKYAEHQRQMKEAAAVSAQAPK